MDARLIAVATPVFIVLIALERFLTRRWQDPAYRLHDAIADLSCGLGEQALAVFLFVAELGLYTWFYDHARMHTFSPRSPWSWVVLVLLVDVAYYWFHRASHRINFLWAVHGVHHQSEEYNFAVALRQGWVEPLAIAPFHWPIAMLGFPPWMFFLVFTAHTLWQFWPHTRGIGRLPRLDRWLNSPANHRCHHAINPPYIDKNYGGLLIVWDRLFGTWAEESEPPAYGTVKPLLSWNPFWAQLSYWQEIGRLMKACPAWTDKLQALVRPPEWRPAALGGPVAIPDVDRTQQRRYEVRASRARDVYTSVSFALVALALPLVTQAPPGLAWTVKGAMVAFTLASITSVAGIVERKAWATPLEIARLTALPAIAWLYAGPTTGTLLVGVIAAVWLSAYGVVVRSSAASAT